MVDADVTFRSDHLPLRKFLAKNPLNSKVNNWAVEISPFRIWFEYIKGIKNTFADTMSCLVNIDPETKQNKEPQGCEFGYYVFDTIPPISVENIQVSTEAPKVIVTDSQGHELTLLDLLKTEDDLQRLVDRLDRQHYEIINELQAQDPFCTHIVKALTQRKVDPNCSYYLEGDTLRHRITEGSLSMGVIVLSRLLVEPMLYRAHDMLGHNGTGRTYLLLNCLYYWRGMNTSIAKYI